MKNLLTLLTLITFASSLNLAHAEDTKENTIQDESDQRIIIEASSIGDEDTVYDSDPANHKEQ